MPTVFSNMDIETLKLMDHLSLNKQINNEINRRERIGAKTNVVLAQKEVDNINALIAADSKEVLIQGNMKFNYQMLNLNLKQLKRW